MNIDEENILTLIRQGESLVLEFKGDTRPLPDRELVAAIVSLANTEGGDLLLGVEDDGTVTGLHPNHANLSGMAALVANRTNPAISVRVENCTAQGKTIARIYVPKSSSSRSRWSSNTSTPMAPLNAGTLWNFAGSTRTRPTGFFCALSSKVKSSR